MRRFVSLLQYRQALHRSVLAWAEDPLVNGPRLLNTVLPSVTDQGKSGYDRGLRQLCRLPACYEQYGLGKELFPLRHVHCTPRMNADVLLAQTGEGIKECELIQWFVEEGDTVAEFDQLCEVQSDKAAVEITSQYAGIITKLHQSPGDMVQVGEVLLSIDTGCGAEVMDLAGLQGSSQAAPTCSATYAAGASAEGIAVTLASPAVRRVAREYGVELASVVGSGPDGRITKGDVLNAANQQRGSSSQPSASPEMPLGNSAEPSVQILTPSAKDSQREFPSSSPPPQAEQSTVIPLRGYRRAMVQSMTAAGAVPHFHYCDEVAMGHLLRLRATLLSDPALQGHKLTFLPFMLKAVSVALRQWPDVNSSLSADGQALQRHASHNLGVAMATPSGLVVPNIKAVEARSIVGIAQELSRLQVLAQAGRLGQEDLSGGTLTVSNIGAIGGTYATPLVNVPEVAIVALGKVREVAQVNADGKLEMVPKLAASWGADHRVIDGATLAQFSNTWKAYVEQPERLLLHLH